MKSVGEQDIRAAYLLFLGREPESEHIYINETSSGQSDVEFYANIMASVECSMSIQRLLSNHAPIMETKVSEDVATLVRGRLLAPLVSLSGNQSLSKDSLVDRATLILECFLSENLKIRYVEILRTQFAEIYEWRLHRRPLKDDVARLYNLFLGRSPESDEVFEKNTSQKSVDFLLRRILYPSHEAQLFISDISNRQISGVHRKTTTVSCLQWNKLRKPPSRLFQLQISRS